jgi:hypothetical protein
MKFSSFLTASALTLALVAGPALAQTPATPAPAPAAKSAPAPAAKAAPAAKPAPMAKSTTEKSTVSKECSDQANAKGLHGKERKKFRSSCKKNDGKAT